MILYLIAHKVRGEPAFDIACRMEMSDGPWWIIPTSGHRAYPYFYTRLEWTLPLPVPMPADLPDHYPSAASPAKRASVESRKASQTVPTLEDI